jgi:hypothetical protein
MRNKVILLAISALLLILPAFGCITDDSKAPAASAAFVSATQHAADIAGLQGSLAKKADQTSVDMLVKMMPAGGATATDTYPKTQLYTKTEVDAAITAAVNAAVTKAVDDLKVEKPWLTGTPSGSGGSSTTIRANSTMVSSDGELELWLEYIDPNRTDMRFSSDVEFALAIKNKDVTTRKYSLEIRLTPDVTVTVAAAPTTMTARPDMGAWILERTDIGTSSKNAVTLSTTSVGRISREAIDKYVLRVRLNETASSAYWKAKFYLTEEES